MKKKSVKKPHLIKLHMYGIFDIKEQKMLRISLDPTDIEMEIPLLGGLNENLSVCEFNIKLSL